MNRLEYRVSSAVLRVLGWLFSALPVKRNRVVLATARTSRLDGNLLFLHRAIRELRPTIDCALVLEPYSYGLLGKLRYALRLIRGTYLLHTSRLVVVDNAWLPVHVAPHRRATEVVQVWHAEGALKRFGVDAVRPLHEPERTFLHRHYDWVVTSGEASRAAWSRAFRTPLERVIALGSPRTDLFFDAAALAEARARVLAAQPELEGRRVILYAPTFRGRGPGKRPSPGLDAIRLRAALPAGDALVLKTHPNLDRRLVSTGGYDVIVDPLVDLNDLLVMTDILITDYSSAIFDFALTRRPLVVLLEDLEAYERDPGLYLDIRAEVIGTHVADTDGVIDAISEGRFDLEPYDAFVARHLGAADGRASARFVERFLPTP
ncbi:MAG TPA: CDP-glycerol glycerophosphotransferase family protein [Candidatus Limnocylindria bacterium]|nr:CDP-glycerol glycerophosphotransferase family protein [Candidatus Limnocylindria bacterium]